MKLTDYKEIESALRNGHLHQSLYDEGKILMDRVLVTLHGEEHRTRRMIESSLFRRNFFRRYEHEIFPGILQETLDAYLTEPHCDLKDLAYRIMVNLSLQFAGIDRQDNSLEEADVLHGLLNSLGHAATLGQFSGDRTAIKAQINQALEKFTSQFYIPSRGRRQQLIDQLNRGEISEEELPRDILTVILSNKDKLDMDDDMMMRECGFFFLAGSHTSVHTTLHAVNEVLDWLQANKKTTEDIEGDLLFLQRMVLESIRLHPASPEAWRKADKDVTLDSGREIKKGDKVRLSFQECNRSEQIFGEDAAEFNAERKCPVQTPATGMSFGNGVHVCLGQNLVAGTVLRPGAEVDPDNHQYGTIANVLNKLLALGITRDPENPPRKDLQSERDIYTSYPVIFEKL